MKRVNRCDIGARVSAYRVAEAYASKRTIGTLHSVTEDGKYCTLVCDGKRILCHAPSLKRARKVQHNEYRFGNRVTATHQPIIGR